MVTQFKSMVSGPLSKQIKNKNNFFTNKTKQNKSIIKKKKKKSQLEKVNDL